MDLAGIWQKGRRLPFVGEGSGNGGGDLTTNLRRVGQVGPGVRSGPLSREEWGRVRSSTSGSEIWERRCVWPSKERKTRKTPEEDRRISEQARRTPIINAVQIVGQLQLHVSRKTVYKRLHEAGVHHRIPAEKEKLTERHRNGLLVFAQQHVNMDLDYWGRVIFPDEKTFSNTTHGRPHCWRRNGTRYNRENIYEVARSGHVTCNMWGWVHLYGVGELIPIDGRLTAEKYIEILEEVIVPTVRAMNGLFSCRLCQKLSHIQHVHNLSNESVTI